MTLVEGENTDEYPPPAQHKNHWHRRETGYDHVGVCI